MSAEITGWIDAAIKLTGMPDLCLNFINPRVLDDVSFHPCVRYKKWEQEKVLSFVPPDGNFRLISYHLSSNKSVELMLLNEKEKKFWGDKGVKSLRVSVPFLEIGFRPFYKRFSSLQRAAIVA